MSTTFLEVVDAQGRRRQFELALSRLVIGREPTCDIHLPHPGVSRRHAQLQRTDQGRWLLQDLSSRNHIYVDNRPVQQIMLETRKPFRIAEYWLALQETPSGVKPGHDQAGEVLMDDTADTALNEEAGWLEHLNHFQRALGSIEDPSAILERLAKEFRRTLQPQMIAVGVARLDGYVWEIVLGDNPDPALPQLEEADAKVAEDHSSFHTWTAPNGSNGDTPSPSPPLCMLYPMKGRSGLIGHVYVVRPAFTPVPKPLQRYLNLATHFTGLTYDNLQLSLNRQDQIEMEKELHHARQIQIDLFPPTFEVDPRLDVFAVNLPSAKVSGDYYDLIRTGPHQVAFVIADAMGHGMPAALLMASVRAALRVGLTLDLAWPAVFQGLDDLICQARSDTFVTGLIGLLDLRTQELSMVSAGHPLPSVLVDGKPVLLPENAVTRPWGLDLESSWEVGKVSLKGNHWSILCYTDGITDAAARTQRTFGAQRVSAYHQKNAHLSAEDLCQGLLTEVAVQPGVTSLGDDQTVLALCSAGSPTPSKTMEMG
jgi:serine phosphatase RsbU (regulator of sigma subunit)